MMNQEAEQRVNEWLNSPIDAETKAAIQALIATNPTALNDAFSTTLSFGTGGMRGLMGVGTSQINRYTIQMATQGLANYLKTQPNLGSAPHVFIGYDSRHNSKEFALETARVLAGNGIGSYLTCDLRPTPYVSFGVRQKRCVAGVMITASHNPKEYNGYKVYWADGGQVVSPHDKGIVAEVVKIRQLSEVKVAMDNSPLIEILDPEFDLEYLEAIHKLQVDPKEDKQVGDHLKITFTPLHGTGITLMPKALASWGFTQVNLVDRQIVPDGDFPTVTSPNPESRVALQMGITQMESTLSDIMIATDPDADRIAIACMHKGAPYYFNGNQIAAICLEYLCQQYTAQQKLTNHHAVVSTIVSTDLLSEISRQNHLPFFSVLTGFKYIGELIHQWEGEKSPHKFLFGAEESYGYLIGTHSRDKDAIVTGCLLAEIALLMKVEGRTLVDFLEEIYQKYGFFWEKQKTIEFPPGLEGMNTMEKMMDSLRTSPPKGFGEHKIDTLDDYLKEISSGTLTLPKSNVLYFHLEGGGKVIVRPSGTEPKLKIYAGLKETSFTNLEEAKAKCELEIDTLLSSVETLLS